MLNIEKYKDVIPNMKQANIACCVRSLIKGKCIANCKECKKEALEWLTEEYKEPVLDDVEKAYLRAVIKPFRKNVNYISKIDVNYPAFNQFISIKVNHTQCVNLPNFSKKSGMYKGMELNKHYSLEELGL